MKMFKKIFSISLVLLLSLCLFACNKNNNNPEPEVTVSSVEILSHQESIYIGEEYDEASVTVKVTFSDETNKEYSGNDLSFSYNDFDFYTPGEYTIKVRVKELNVTQNITVEVIKKHIKVLFISNSFGDDTVQWVHEIAEDLGMEFTIANLYIGGCILSTHLQNLIDDEPAYEYLSYNKTTHKWTKYPYTSIKQGLQKEDWDYVVLQQGSYESGRANSYSTIDTIMDKVLEIKSDVQFLWNMTWAYQQNSGHANFGIYGNDQMTMYNGILNAVQTKVVPNERIKMIIPNGTAVQNARTSFYGDNFCRDVYCHLTYEFGRYIAGLTLVATITGADISEISYTPGLDELQKAVAIESVLNALENPFEITQSKYGN